MIFAYTYNGGCHKWLFDDEKSQKPIYTVGGHFDEVTDLWWDPDGHYLISCSKGNHLTFRLNSKIVRFMGIN